MTKLEEVAARIAERRHPNAVYPQPEDFELAKIAVTALRQPSQAMVRAVPRRFDDHEKGHEWSASDIWEPMIDAILTEKP